ncbi:MAG: glutamine--fructose-6-phosphate transaminase (isomerizing) [Alphaproteobacteria bacterium]|nr:glutamine--fructose-6-phosphate transaminase (isomerizing) [Alphaproteobacteria bacterium]
MCGIFGYCGNKPASNLLIEGLKRLEYRGYDSAGICVGVKDGFSIVKRTGKLKNLQKALPEKAYGRNGIVHTRWATHGGVTEANAHPHTDCTGKIAIVHNGIIENYAYLKERLQEKGHVFKSETDSEVIAHLIEERFKGNLTQAVMEILPLLKGTYGLIVMHQDCPDILVGARNGSPLVLGVGNDEMFLASDVAAMVSYTQQVVYLNDGEVVTLTPSEFITTDLESHPIEKDINTVEYQNENFDKQGFNDFMLKEIHEQPESIKRGLVGRLDKTGETGHLGGLNMTSADLLNVERIVLVAAGTSYYAGQTVSYLIEKLAHLPTKVELASELRYKNIIIEKNTLYFVISQSGETADTLFALRELKRKGAKVLGICNAVGSTIARETDGGVYIHSGPEIAVASTKAFTSQLTALYIFSLIMGRIRFLSNEQGSQFIKAFQNVPILIEEILSQKEHIHAVAEKYKGAKNFLFLGRGINYPVAMEGALKLKEISYIHAEGFGAGELKHGPIALINEETPSFMLIPKDSLYEKNVSNLKEIKARKGKVIALVTKGDTNVSKIADDIIEIPEIMEDFIPFLAVVPLQIFAYFVAKELGRDVDQPRNLAKSVTVE